MDKPLAKLEFVCSLVLFSTLGLMQRLIDMPTDAVAWYRGAVGALFIACYFLIKKKRLHPESIRKNLPWLLLSGVFLVLNWTLLLAAYVTTTVAVASLCNYMAPIFLIFLSPILFRERLTGRKLLCVLAAFAGIVLVSGVLSDGGEGVNLPGVLLGLAAAVGFTGIVICNKKMQDMDPLDKTLVQLMLTAAFILPYTALKNHGLPTPPDLHTALLVLTVGVVQTGLAYILYFGPMGKLRVQTISILGYVEPVIAVFLSAFFLREPMPLPGWIGAALILGAAVASELLDHQGATVDG